MRIRLLACVNDLFSCSVGLAHLEVRLDGRVEENRLLRDERNSVAQPLDVEVREGDAVELDLNATAEDNALEN